MDGTAGTAAEAVTAVAPAPTGVPGGLPSPTASAGATGGGVKSVPSGEGDPYGDGGVPSVQTAPTGGPAVTGGDGRTGRAGPTCDDRRARGERTGDERTGDERTGDERTGPDRCAGGDAEGYGRRGLLHSLQEKGRCEAVRSIPSLRTSRLVVGALGVALLAWSTAAAGQSKGAPTPGAKPAATSPPVGARSPATAQPAMAHPPAASPPAVASPPVDEVGTWFKQAEAARDAGKFDEAATLLGKAWARRKTWDIAGNLGLTEKKLGRLVPAAEHLSFALANLPPTVDEDAREGLSKALAAVRAEVATVRLGVNVEGAEVSIGGEAKGKSPLGGEVFTLPGRVTIEAKKDGFEPAARTVEMKKGEVQEVALELKVKEALPPPERSKVPAFILGGVAVASWAAGGGLLGAYAGKRDEVASLQKNILDTKRSCVPGAENFDARCKDLEGAARTGDDFNRAGIGLLIGGGVLAAGAVGYWLWPQDKTLKRGMRVVPVASSEYGGFVASGEW